MSTQGVILSRSVSRSFMYACGSDWITKHPERCAKRHLANAAQTTSGGRGRRHLANAYETPSGRRVITAWVTRRGRRRAVGRTPSGGRVITASFLQHSDGRVDGIWRASSEEAKSKFRTDGDFTHWLLLRVYVKSGYDVDLLWGYVAFCSYKSSVK